MIWGLLHGAFLVLERVGLARLLDRLWSPLRHGYCLAVVLAGWVFFRLPTAPAAKTVLAAMVGLGAHGAGAASAHPAIWFLDNERLLALAAGVVGSVPWLPWVRRRWAERSVRVWPLVDLAKLAALGTVGVVVAMRLSSGTYNPFIYFRF